MSSFGKPFGYYLKAKRQQLGLSQADLSERTKIQRTSISRLESHAGNPQWQLIKLIAEDGMGIPMAEFFQVESTESKQPMIHIQGQTPAPKLAELMLKTQGKAIPLLCTETPLRSKVVTDADIGGFIVLDYAMIGPWKDRPLVSWKCCPEDQTLDWALVDIEDTKIVDGGIYLFDMEKVVLRRTWLTPKGALILDAVGENCARPDSYWGRQKDRIIPLGRVVMTAQSRLTTVSP